MDVIHIRPRKKRLNARVHAPVLNVRSRDQVSASPISVQCSWARAQFSRKTSIFRIPFARIRVNVNRPRQRQRLDAFECIQSK